MSLQKSLKLLSCILLCESAGMVGAIFTYPAIGTWYAGLAKPAFSPPNWVFAPVWTILFALMGIALYLVWEQGWQKREVREAVELFLGHLVINIAWSVAFFGLHKPLLAFFGIILLLAYIIVLIRLFAHIRLLAAYLLFPYLLWVGFATVLNFELWRLN